MILTENTQTWPLEKGSEIHIDTAIGAVGFDKGEGRNKAWGNKVLKNNKNNKNRTKLDLQNEVFLYWICKNSKKLEKAAR